MILYFQGKTTVIAKSASCCNGSPYNKTTQLCCGRTTVENKESPDDDRCCKVRPGTFRTYNSKKNIKCRRGVGLRMISGKWEFVFAEVNSQNVIFFFNFTLGFTYGWKIYISLKLFSILECMYILMLCTTVQACLFYQ